MNYRLIRSIDILVQRELKKCQLQFDINENKLLKVAKYQVDTESNAVLIYLLEPKSVPGGKSPFVVIDVEGIYGVFAFENKAVILEASSSILEFI